MAYVKILIHAVWATKNHCPYLTKDVKEKLLAHIWENARKKEIYIKRINGHLDHLHCLLSLNADMSIAKTMQLIKGESAHWMNKQNIIKEKFEWADEYYAASVSEGAVMAVQNYIEKQEEHHKHKTFSEEYEEFILANKLKELNFK